MLAVVAVVKEYFIPGSLWFLLAGLAVGVGLLYIARLQPWGRRWLLALLLFYVALSLPLVSDRLRAVPQLAPIREPTEIANAAAIVVLGTGVATVGPPEAAVDLPMAGTALNLAEGARLYKLVGQTRVIVSGGIPREEVSRRSEAEVMQDYLVRLGVRPEDITLEPQSVNTTGQAHNVAALLPRGARIALVTVPVHMPRAAALFESRGLVVTRAVSVAYTPPHRPWHVRLTPSAFALRRSEIAIYEWLARVYYRMNGEIAVGSAS
jgi:uncharacterized SAM-binding protein YcdF (DUF218 family)